MLHRLPVHCFAAALFVALTVVPAAALQRSDFGTLAIQVRPPDAVILIDGERWVGPESAGPLLVQLTPGLHRVELRSPGHRPYVANVLIRSGLTTPLNVELATGTPPRLGAQGVQMPNGIAETEDDNGFVIAPDFRVSEIDHRTGELAGAYGGYVFAGRVMIGGGAYWQANTVESGRLMYGGPVLEWRVLNSRRIGFNLHGLVGGGEWQTDEFFGHPQPFDARIESRVIRFGQRDESFFLTEPDAQVVIRFGAHVRLQAGAGYRVTSANGLNGATGSLSLQIGR